MTVETLLFSNTGGTVGKILQLPFNIGSYRATRQKIKAFKPDIVHIHNLHFAASFSIPYALKAEDIPFVTTLHNFRYICPSATLFHRNKPFTDSIRQRFPWTAVRQGVYKDSRLLTFWLAFSMSLHRRLGTLDLCSRYIVLSEHAKKLFLSCPIGLDAEKLVIKQNFCDPSPVKGTHDNDHFLFVGRLSEEKGIATLLDAFARSAHKIRIAGDGPLKEEVIRYAGLFPNIEYVGLLEKKEVLSLLSECTALIFPSVWPEGMPMTIIEAFSCGTPVIASRLGVMESMITNGSNGLHFEAGNGTDLLNKLHRWADMNLTERAGFYENALATFDKYYTPEKNFELLSDIYTDAIKLNGYSIYSPTAS
jgi:glycosyltransferase involved in cell wall biosynthesis